MNILSSLGVNSTLWIQLACFLVSYVALSNLVLKPYLAALTEREKRTIGNEETAIRLIEEANNLYAQYEKKAREINSEMKSEYDVSRAKALKEAEALLHSAREEAATLLDSARSKITGEIQTARKSLSADVPAIGSAIASKLAGKEISL